MTSVHKRQMIALLLFLAKSVESQTQATPTCPEESALNIQSGTITVTSNAGWVIGGWGFASPFNKKNYGGNKYNWGSSNYGYGNFGNYNQGNGNFGTGNLGNGNLGNYNVGEDNCGNYNVGTGNSGQWNVGTGNNGTYNLGSGNIGGGNTGIANAGNNNVGGLNSGSNNLGIQNSGSSNLGTSNTGTENVGWSNTGNWNIGSSNTGNGNVGSSNTGNFSIGFLNLGSNNTGAWNYGTGNVGYLSGVEESTISQSSGGIYWKNVQVNQVAPLSAVNQTGWVNLNSTNVGIGQSGFRNLGYLNIGEMNIGSYLNGTNNTGTNLIGSDLIGTNQDDGSSGAGDAYTPVTINGIQSDSVNTLLNSSVYGYVQDNLISTYSQVYQQSLSVLQSTATSELSPSTCQSFVPLAISNTFSISVRCRGSVKITDLFCSGDSFTVYKDGKLWFTTPVVSVDNDPYCLRSQADPEEAFYDPEFSHAIGWVPSGSYKISVYPTSTRWGGGAVAIKVDDFCDRVGFGRYQRF